MTDSDRESGVSEFPAPEVAYAHAPDVVTEIGWVSKQARRIPNGLEIDREYWLRKAALVDRIALARVVTHTTEDALEAAQMASNAAVQLIEYDERQGDGDERPAAGSIRFSDAIVCAGYRSYVRKQYFEWSRPQRL